MLLRQNEADSPTPKAKDSTRQAAPVAKLDAPQPPAAAGPTGEAASPASEKLSEEQRADIAKKIEEASVMYDAKALPLIEPYLLHPDPEVRTAALNGMITLGEAGAAPLLREAAKKAATPKEAVAMGEAADYLELPSGTFVPKERTAAGTRTPLEGKATERTRPRFKPKPGAVEGE